MTEKKKLVLFQPFIGPYRIDYTNDLSKAFEARIYMKSPQSDDQAFKQQELTGQLCYSPRYLPVGSVVKLFKTIRHEFAEFQPDIVVTFEFDIITLFVLALRFFGKRKFKIVGMSDDSHDMLTGNDFTWKHKVARELLAGRLDNLILVEPESVDWYKKKTGKGFFFPIIRDESVVRAHYRDALPLVDDTVARYSLDGQFVFLFVGRLVGLKNIDRLIKAFSRFDQSANKLVIVGDGPERAGLEQLAGDLGLNVLFVGRKEGPALNVWYLVANALILPSLQEAFGAVTNEALIAGCRVIVSRRAGSNCLVSEGENGYIIDPEDIDDIYMKMEQVKALPEPGISGKDLRPSLMKCSYRELFNDLCDLLDSV